MADQVELLAEKRTDLGKGASRRLRRNADMVPAIIYGAGKDPVSIAIPHKDLHKACESEAFYSQIISITADGTTDAAILKDLQRHPARDRILHADFFRVSMDQEITVEVPLHFLNEEDCVGVKQGGGMLSHNMTVLEITCLPGSLPEFIEVNVAELNIGDHIMMSDLTLAEGLVIPALALGEDHDQVIVAVHEQKREIEVGSDEAADEAETPEGDASEEPNDDD